MEAHRICNMTHKGESLRECAKVNKKTNKKEHYWVDKYECPTCHAKLEKNRNGFSGSTAVCNGTPHGIKKAKKKAAKRKTVKV